MLMQAEIAGSSQPGQGQPLKLEDSGSFLWGVLGTTPDMGR